MTQRNQTNASRGRRTRALLRTVARPFARFGREEDGVAAIEYGFALSLFFVPLWMGFAEVASMQDKSTTLNTTTAMVADMIAQYQSVTQKNLNDVLTTGEYVLGADAMKQDSNGNAQLDLMVKGVIVPKTGSKSTTPYVAWSMSNTSKTTCSVGSALPVGVSTPTATDRLLIVVDGKLEYDSPLNWFRTGPTKIDHRSVYAPRLAASHTGPNPCAKPT